MSNKPANHNNAVCAKHIHYNDGRGNRVTASIFALVQQPNEEFFVGHTKYFEGEIGVEYRPVLVTRAIPYIQKGKNGQPDSAKMRNTVIVNWERA